jgi:hypothetical protein
MHARLRADAWSMADLHAVPAAPQPTMSPFEEWARLTRFLESARLAFARERSLWESLRVEDPKGVRIAAAAHEGNYNVELKKHLDAIDDAETLHGSVLVHFYAIAEHAAAGRLGTSSRSFQGIEDWGARLLKLGGSDWSAVKGGLAGAVEVAVVRNAFAHGSRTIDAAGAARLFTAGAATRPEGARVTLPYPQLRQFRGRLMSLLRAGGISG